jgi:hypothetical protein
VTSRAWRWAGLVSVALVMPARAARAADAFEIQVYDGTADAPRQAALEAHLNYVASGVTVSTPPELPPNHQAHFTLEPSYGVLATWELGAYFLTALRPDGTFEVVGGKLRSKHVTPPGWSAHMRFGVNVELSLVRAAYEADRWGAELRPIAAWEGAHLLVAFNPIVDISLRGGAVSLAPAALAVVPVRGVASFGLEYYGDLGGVTDPAPVRQQQHYLYEVANLIYFKSFELNAGVGEGLTAASNAVVVKVILGHVF